MASKDLTSISEQVMSAYERLKSDGRIEIVDESKFEMDLESVSKFDLLSSQGLPKRLLKNLHSSFQSTYATKSVDEFHGSDDNAWCLVLSGDKGCGKSTAAAYWLYSILTYPRTEYDKRRVTTKTRRWYSSSRIQRISDYKENGSELEKLFVVPHLVIDDLGVEYLDAKGYTQKRFDEILDERYSNFRKTLITTNLNARDFRDRYGTRIFDRIREGLSSGGAFVEIGERSYRAAKNGE